MAPDLNSLPPSSPSSLSRAMHSNNSNSESNSAVRGEHSASPTSRSASISLQAAATMNAGLQHEPGRRSSSSSLSRNRSSPNSGRRRSSVLMNLQLNDPSLPAPGELVAGESSSHLHNLGIVDPAFRTVSPQPISGSPLLTGGDPHHHRAPSLGELHQELEAEQEAQVNRLLQMIREQQLQLQQLQAAQGQTGTAGHDDTTVSERHSSAVAGTSVPASAQSPFPALSSTPRSPVTSHPRSSFDASRPDLYRLSRTPSQGPSSPRMRSTSISGESGDQFLLGARDETAFYQAETQSLVRENQMLRHRIRELERQIGDQQPNPSASLTREPAQHSQLTQTTSVSEDNVADVAVPAASSAAGIQLGISSADSKAE